MSLEVVMTPLFTARLFAITAVVTMAANAVVVANDNPALRSDSVCAVTPAVDRLPSVIAPMAGAYPAWLVTDSVWPGRNVPAKSALVLSRDAPGPLIVTGHRVDGPGVLGFRDGADDIETKILTIADPARRSVTPGGATRSIMASYAFIMMLVSYPTAGCWKFNVQLGEHEVSIIRELR